jgi:hypothetical protein
MSVKVWSRERRGGLRLLDWQDDSPHSPANLQFLSTYGDFSSAVHPCMARRHGRIFRATRKLVYNALILKCMDARRESDAPMRRGLKLVVRFGLCGQ